MKTERRFQIVCVQLNNVLSKQIDDIEQVGWLLTPHALEQLDALRQKQRDEAEILQRQQQVFRRKHPTE